MTTMQMTQHSTQSNSSSQNPCTWKIEQVPERQDLSLSYSQSGKETGSDDLRKCGSGNVFDLRKTLFLLGHYLAFRTLRVKIKARIHELFLIFIVKEISFSVIFLKLYVISKISIHIQIHVYNVMVDVR